VQNAGKDRAGARGVNGSPKNGENLFCCWKNMGVNQWKCCKNRILEGEGLVM